MSKFQMKNLQIKAIGQIPNMNCQILWDKKDENSKPRIIS